MSTLPFHPHRQTRGFGLLETILVFALILGGGALIFSVFQSAQLSEEASSEVANLTTLAGNIRSTFGLQHNYTGLSTSSVLRSKAVPQSMVQGTKVINQWGYAVTFSVNENPTKFNIAYGKVPTEVCLKFITGMSRFFPDIQVSTGKVVTNGVVDYPFLIRECAGGSTNVTFTGN